MPCMSDAVVDRRVPELPPHLAALTTPLTDTELERVFGMLREEVNAATRAAAEGQEPEPVAAGLFAGVVKYPAVAAVDDRLAAEDPRLFEVTMNLLIWIFQQNLGRGRADA